MVLKYQIKLRAEILSFLRTWVQKIVVNFVEFSKVSAKQVRDLLVEIPMRSDACVGKMI